jgi:hypothetical protein
MNTQKFRCIETLSQMPSAARTRLAPLRSRSSHSKRRQCSKADVLRRKKQRNEVRYTRAFFAIRPPRSRKASSRATDTLFRHMRGIARHCLLDWRSPEESSLLLSSYRSIQSSCTMHPLKDTRLVWRQKTESAFPPDVSGVDYGAILQRRQQGEN